MTISLSSLRSNIFTDIYNVLNSNVSDPLSRGKQWIFTSVPDVTAPNFVGFPILIVSKARIGKDFGVFDNEYFDKRAVVYITVYATNNVVLDSLSDSVDNVMLPSNFPQFRFYDYNESDGTADFGSGTVYFRKMTYSIELQKVS